jgi:hypothetical protein
VVKIRVDEREGLEPQVDWRFQSVTERYRALQSVTERYRASAGPRGSGEGLGEGEGEKLTDGVEQSNVDVGEEYSRLHGELYGALKVEPCSIEDGLIGGSVQLGLSLEHFVAGELAEALGATEEDGGSKSFR